MLWLKALLSVQGAYAHKYYLGAGWIRLVCSGEWRAADAAERAS